MRLDDKEYGEFLGKFSKMDRPLRERILVDAVGTATHVFEARIKDVNLTASPGPSDDLHAVTGRLRSSVVAQPARLDGNNVIGLIVVGAKYAIYPEEGTTGPYPIKPRVAKVLAWPIGSTIFGSGKRAGQINFRARGVPMAFAKYVRYHPGLRARRPFGRAIEHGPTRDAFSRIVLDKTVEGIKEELAK